MNDGIISISIYHYQIFMDYIKPISDFLISLLNNRGQISEILSIFETRTHHAQIGQSITGKETIGQLFH